MFSFSALSASAIVPLCIGLAKRDDWLVQFTCTHGLGVTGVYWTVTTFV